MAIQRLSSKVVSSLRTDVTVTTTAQCVTELVLNSIDAGATSIAVRVDLKKYKIQVIDNGRGLSLSDMNVVGTRYMTSKCHSLQDLKSNLSHFGFRGEALSSISEVCGVLTVVSRHQDSEETYCKLFIQGVPHKAGKSQQQRASCGTTITVADFLYNRPVRRARAKYALEIEEIKSYIECVALINYQVSFSLRNDVNNEIILQTQRCRDIPSAFGGLFGHDIAKHLVPVENNFGPFKVVGYISNEAHLLKNLQFIYVNRRLVLKTKLHKLVNSLMARSAILKSNNVQPIPISKEMNHSAFLAFDPPKRDKHAIFILNVSCPFSEYDITLDPRKTLIEFCNWDSLLSCFKSLLRKFIERESNHEGEQSSQWSCKPTQRRQTVVDEINQLAREEALTSHVTAPSQECVDTRALTRVVYGLPARRDQVKLSVDSANECFLSTVSSDLCSGWKKDVERKDDPRSQPIFTENPFPPLSGNEPSNDKLKTKPSEFSIDTDSMSTVKWKSKNSVNKKELQESPVLFKKPVKGFTTKPCYFEDRYRGIPDCPVSRSKSFKDAADTSPVDALSNIKEIRRKKLLQNLNKFSFKKANAKPLLSKMEVQNNLPKPCNEQYDSFIRPETIPRLCGEKPCHENILTSGAMQTVMTPANTDCAVDLISVQATCQSSIRSSEGLLKSSNMAKPSNNPPFRDSSDGNAVNKGVDNFNVLTSNMPQLDSLYQGSQENYPEILHVPSTAKCMNFVSVEDMIVTEDACDESQESLRIDQNWYDSSIVDYRDLLRVARPSFHQGCRTDFGNKLPVESVLPSGMVRTLNLAAPKTSVPPVFANDFKERKTPEIIKTSPPKTSLKPFLFSERADNVMTRRKLVDYDSSPTSSQESTVTLKDPDMHHAGSQLMKRVSGEISQEIVQKKICLSPKLSLVSEEVEPTICNLSKAACNETHNSAPTVNKVLNLQGDSFSKLDAVSFLSDTNCQIFSDNERSGTVSSKCEVYSEPLSSKRPDETATLNLLTQCETAVDQASTSGGSMNAGDEKNNFYDDTSHWIERHDDVGKPFYIHRISGMTTYNRPNDENVGAFKLNDRFACLPKGMSPIFMDKMSKELTSSPSITHFREEDLSSVKWESDAKLWPLIDQLFSEADKFTSNTCSESQISNATVENQAQSDIKVYNVMFPYSFSKDIFHNLKVLGQLDNKFIVTSGEVEKNREVIMLFDQHAVHERIRVESLTHEYKQHDGSALWKSAPVEPALPLPLSLIEVRILQSYQSKMESLGFHFTVIDSNTVSVLRVPTCLLLRENREVTGRGVSVLRQHLESLIREQVDCLLNTRGAGTGHPTIIQSVISSEACKGAVKFGHSLTISDCQAFLHNLSSCDLPFQCAHGRPSLMPIVDLSLLKQRPPRKRLNFQRLKIPRKRD